MGLFFITLATILLSPAPAQAELKCRAVYRSLDSAERTVEKSAVIPLARVYGEEAKYELDFEGRFYAITENRKSGDLFAQITVAPDYTKGTVLRGAADSEGRFTASEVVGFTVHRLECDKAQ